jgi:hypothetical protein
VDEWGSYVVAALILFVLGVWLRTPVLNWIVGPGLVVLVVVQIGRWKDQRAAERNDDPDGRP